MFCSKTYNFPSQRSLKNRFSTTFLARRAEKRGSNILS